MRIGNGWESVRREARVAVEDIEIRNGLVIPGREVTQLASRASGPGGQHVNKTSTRVTLRWSIADSAAREGFERQRLLSALRPSLTQDGELIVHADRSRSQVRNLEAARERLAELVAGALKVDRARRPTRPSRSAKRRRVDDKKKRSSIKRTRGRVGDRDA
jgi:ribosome-associated protein